MLGQFNSPTRRRKNVSARKYSDEEGNSGLTGQLEEEVFLEELSMTESRPWCHWSEGVAPKKGAKTYYL